MRVLLTNITLQGFSGTETAARDLVLGLLRKGHEVMVYSPRLGPIAQEMARAGAVVSDDLASFLETPDVIHGHHLQETTAALTRFPQTPAIFVVHDARAWHDIPPLSPQVKRYVCVGSHGLARLERYGVPREAARLILNTFDPNRFCQRARIRKQPRRALYFCTTVSAHASLEPLRAACGKMGVRLDVAGPGLGRLEAHPEALLERYDLVFGTGRCAIEAMATGAAVILYGPGGLGQRLTTENIAELREKNLGLPTLTRPHEMEAIAAEIRACNAAETLALCRYIRENASVEGAAEQYLAVYREAIAANAAPAGDAAMTALQALAIRAAELEYWFVQEFPMRPLAADIGSHLTLRIVACPEQVSRIFSVEAELDNRCGTILSSVAPHPVQFAFHWYDERGCCVSYESARTPIPRAIAPGETKRVYVAVSAPPGEGRFRLRITLVQEGLFWFDELTPPLFAEAWVTRVSAKEANLRGWRKLARKALEKWRTLRARG